MIEHTLDQVAAAIRRRDEMVTTLRPRIYEFLGTLFAGMIEREISKLAAQIGDEDGIRRYFFGVQPVEKFERLYRVRIAKAESMSKPLLTAEIFGDSPGELRGITQPLASDDVAELYTFIADLQNDEAHARMEVTADAVAVLMKPRSH
ncbi:MAG: hypothetical protein ABI333_25515 [bacterium]